MRATLIDGKAIAEKLRDEVKTQVNKRLEKGLPVPGLATVLIGDNPASEVYVRMKHKACEEVGIRSIGKVLPATPARRHRSPGAQPERRLGAGVLVSCSCPLVDEGGFSIRSAFRKLVDSPHQHRASGAKTRTALIPACRRDVSVERNRVELEAPMQRPWRSNIVGMPVSPLLLFPAPSPSAAARQDVEMIIARLMYSCASHPEP